MNRPTIPEAAEVLRSYYRLPGRSNGGAVHIILEDGNVKQGHADWCAAHAADWGRESTMDSEGKFAAYDVAVARMLAAMSTTQRTKLYATHAFYPG